MTTMRAIEYDGHYLCWDMITVREPRKCGHFCEVIDTFRCTESSIYASLLTRVVLF